jgi:hypothetical protein
VRRSRLLSPLILLLLLPLCVLAGCRTGTKTTLWTNMKGKAVRTDTVDLALNPGDTLFLVGDSKDIEVNTSSRAPRVTAELKVVAYTQEEAEKALSAFRVVTKRTSRGLEVNIVGDAGTYETEEGTKVPYTAFATYTVMVSEDVKVIAGSKAGEVVIQGN